MRWINSSVVFLSLALVPLAWADTPANKAGPAPTVEQLIDQLGSRDYRVREAASRAIAAFGADALPKLQQARSSPDPEVRRRLDELIPPIERALTLQPKHLTLHMTNRPMRDVLAELMKQTGYKIAPWEGQPASVGDKTVYTFHFDKLPFWEALDKVCEASGMVLQQNYWGDDTLRLQSMDSYVPFRCYTGPFKIVATGFYYNRSNNFGQLPRTPTQPLQHASESLAVNMTIAVEPKLPIIKVGAIKLTVAEDEEKHSMLPNAEGNNSSPWGQRYYYGGWNRGYVHQTQANLFWPSKTARTVKILQGVIPVTLLADQKPAIVTEKILSAKGKRVKAGQASFTIEDVSELPGKQYQVRMTVTEETKDGNPNDWTRINSLQQRIELQDAKGNKHQFYFNSISNNGPSSAQFTFTVQPSGPNVGPPAKLVYYAWVLMEHEVAFEFKDLPLP